MLSKIKGLLGGSGSLSALCRSLNSPVPMFMGMPIIMHSETPNRRDKGMSTGMSSNKFSLKKYSCSLK